MLPEWISQCRYESLSIPVHPLQWETSYIQASTIGKTSFSWFLLLLTGAENRELPLALSKFSERPPLSVTELGDEW